jgi:hypothetical protein
LKDHKSQGRLINGISPISDAAGAPFMASKSLDSFFLTQKKKMDLHPSSSLPSDVLL